MASLLATVLLAASSALALPTSNEERSLFCQTPATVPYNNDRLPNPFVFDDGAPVQSFADWDCRRSQISALIQGYEAGALPGRPEIVKSTLSKVVNYNANFTVTAGFETGTISWLNTIVYPNTTAPRGGWPLVIAYDGLSIPVPPGIAILTYPNSDIGEQNSSPASRGVGLFYDLYGNVTASSMTAWVWGVSRIIDALEENDSADFNLAKIAVTGCSRDGKGALMAGAFEPRIALTIPQESGSGGDTCWRLSNYEQNEGDVVQQATEIVQENVWFSTNFDNYVYNLSLLPYDHHFLAGMVAPRGLISYENTDVEWLSPLSAYGCMTAAHTIYEALGIPDYHGFMQVGNHSHCVFPAELNESLFAFIDKFLLDQPNTPTNYFSTNGVFNGTVWDPSYWINWATPKFW